MKPIERFAKMLDQAPEMPDWFVPGDKESAKRAQSYLQAHFRAVGRGE